MQHLKTYYRKGTGILCNIAHRDYTATRNKFETSTHLTVKNIKDALKMKSALLEGEDCKIFIYA